MFYIYTIVFPLLILLLNYFVVKPKRFSEYVTLVLRTLPYLYGYMFFMYYLQREHDVRTGGADLGLFIFLIPITAVTLLLKLFFWIKSLRNKKNPLN